MAELLGIAWRQKKRAPMQTLETAGVSTESGVHKDSRGRPGKRQVTLISKKHWDEACAELGKAVNWTARRSNLLVDELDFRDTTGSSITIGEVVLEVCMEVDPCERMEEACPGLRAALTPEWRGGVGCRVIRGGRIRVGDSVEIA